MKSAFLPSRGLLFSALPLLIASRALADGTAVTLTTLWTFNVNNNTSGFEPWAGLTSDAAGNLYGTTFEGGVYSDGTVFKLSADHQTLTTLENFGFKTGNNPAGNLTFDAQGNLYGTTANGPPNHGTGTLFELSGVGLQNFATLQVFNGANSVPVGGVIFDPAGNIYGATQSGGTQQRPYGSIYEVSADHSTLTTLAQFSGTNYSAYPYAGLVADASGNFYGTTYDGTVYELSGANHQTLTTLAVMNGSYPACTLILDSRGNLFGTTEYGGPNNKGTVFELSGSNHQTLTTLATFDGTDGTSPNGLIEDQAGDLFGTTTTGGSNGDGTVFEVAANSQTVTTLATFYGTNGANPKDSLFADASGNLYGTTEHGGVNGDGTIFEIALVPEPSSLSLLAIGGLAVLRRRRGVARTLRGS